MPSPTRTGPAWLIGADDHTRPSGDVDGVQGFPDIGSGATLDDVPHLPMGTLAALPPDQLALLLRDAAEALEQVQRIKDWLEGAVDLKYRDRAAAARAAAGKATGSVRIEDGNFVIVAELPKRVRWDQARLAEAIETIRRDWDDDPAEYVRTELKVAETAYASWPAAVRRLFEPARTVETGKPRYRLELASKEAA